MIAHTEPHATDAPAAVRCDLTAGRRVYIQEQALVRSGLVDADRCAQMVQTAVSLLLPRRLEHALSELIIIGGLECDPRAITSAVVSELDLRSMQSEFFRGVRLRPEMSGGLDHILSAREEVTANCFFSNYFTLATGSRAAAAMFRDTSTMTELKQASPSGLTVIRPRTLAMCRRGGTALTWLEEVGIIDIGEAMLAKLLHALSPHAGIETTEVECLLRPDLLKFSRSLERTTLDQSRATS